MKSIQRRDAEKSYTKSRQEAQKHKGLIDLVCALCLFVAQLAGEQMRHGLKPCDTASDPVENPTRFLVEMRSTQSHFST